MIEQDYKAVMSRPDLGFLAIFAFLSLLITSAAHASSCSPYEGVAFLNEVFGTNQNSFLEIVTTSPDLPSDYPKIQQSGWSVLSCLGSNPNNCNTLLLSSFDTTGPFSADYFFYTLSPVPSLSANNISDLQLLLLDQDGKPIDFLKIDSSKNTYIPIETAINQASCTIDSEGPQNVSAQDRHFYRSPDGHGSWNTGTPGASLGDATQGEPNDPDSLPPSITLNHIWISHPATGLTCAPVTLDFTACADSTCGAHYEGGVEFDLQKNGSYYASISIPPGNSTTTSSLRHTVVGDVTLSLASVDYHCTEANCQITFADTGFRLVDSNGDPANYPTQIAGKASDVTPDAEARFIQAIRTDDQTGACTGIFTSGENVPIEFAAECIDPIACTSDAAYNMQLRDYTNSLMTIATTDAATAWSSVTLTFGTNSMAPLPLMYPDVGQMQLHARYSLPNEEGEPSGDYMYASLAPFVVRPYDFTFTNPTCASNHTDFFCRAGEDFTVDITAVNFNGDITPNFGNESSAQVVTLEHQLVLPAGEFDGSIDPATVNFTGGVASGVSMSWNEVGELALRGKMDGYLGSDAFYGNSWSGPIGRFTPYYFDLDVIGLPNEVYMGAPMSLQLITTALNMDGGITQNYFGAYDYMGDIADRLEITIQGADAAMNSRLRFDPDDVLTPVPDWNNGIATYSIDLFFDRLGSGPDGPHELTLQFGLCDGDDICAQADASTSGPVTYPDTLTARYARMIVGNAHGSELLGELTLPIRVVYYQDGSWLLDSDLTQDYFALTDPVIDDFSFEAIQGPLAADDLEVALAIGMASGTGEVTIEQNVSPKKQGSVYVIPNVPAWLQYDWDGDGVYDDPPRGRATFGIYQGNDRKIYMRERY